MGAYDRTINLPRTDFPMRANLPEREPEIQSLWDREDLYGNLRRERSGRPKFILHDGPPYANGHIHIGTAMNKILKDIVVRYASLRGYDAPFVPGWDTHGLPIEQRAIQELGLDRRKTGVPELRERCAGFARHYIGLMTEQFKRLGVLGDWGRPYVTLDPAYEASQVEVFGEMARRGYIYKGQKPVHWCVACETALAEAEIEYRDKVSPSIYVMFAVKDGKGKLTVGSHVVIWTTTPWTLPGNAAIALHPEGEYVTVETPRGRLVLAAPLAERVLREVGLDAGGANAPGNGPTFRGKDLNGVVCSHPFLDRDVPVVPADMVSLEEGTGCVHIAPGHGPEDFEIGRRYGLPVLVPVDDHGVLTGEAGPFAGLPTSRANEGIAHHLRDSGHLLALGKVEHQYAHCWRCKNPVLFRATEQWFASVDGFRAQALAAVRTVRWIPAWGETRIANMVEGRADWCISRQRAWGVPIPVFYCADCGQAIINEDTVRSVADVFRREGSNAWFTREAAELLPPGYRCPVCDGEGFRKESDTMDVWFDSGSSHEAVLGQRPELAWPADLYLEGSDQHRGWFQSSLLTAVAVRGRAPYRAVLTHGFVVDGEGRKMSKSIGNVVEPQEVISRYGADILRLWVASADYSGDVRVSPDILKQLVEVYRKIRNTIRYLLGNLYDFDPTADSLLRPGDGEAPGGLPAIDRWALHRVREVLRRVTAAYDSYEFHQAYRAVHDFCVLDLSSFYLEVLKDRLYTSGPDSPERRSAQTVLYEIARILMTLIAPILPHTADEGWRHLPRQPGDHANIHLGFWPDERPEWDQPELAQRWDTFFSVREEVGRALEAARAGGLIGGSLEAAIRIGVPPALAAELARFRGELPALLLVSQVDWVDEAALDVTVTKARGGKCARCWVRSETTGRTPDHPDLCDRCASTVARYFSVR